MGFHYIKNYYCRCHNIILYDESPYEVANISYIISNDTAYIRSLLAATSRNNRYIGHHLGTQIFNIFLQTLEDEHPKVCEITGILSSAYIGSWRHSIAYYYSLQKNSISKAGHKLIFHLFDSEDNEILLSDNIKERSLQIEYLAREYENSHKAASFCFDIVNIDDDSGNCDNTSKV